MKKSQPSVKKIKKISAYLESKYPVLFHSVGGSRVREIVSQIMYPKNRRGSIKTKSQLAYYF